MTARTCLTCEYEPAWREQVSLDEGEYVDFIGRCKFPDASLRGVVPEGSLFAGPLMYRCHVKQACPTWAPKVTPPTTSPDASAVLRPGGPR